jgi:hypothetical protein
VTRIRFIGCLVVIVTGYFGLVVLGAILTDVADYIEWSIAEQHQYRDRIIIGCTILVTPFLWWAVDKRFAYLGWPRWGAVAVMGLTWLAFLADIFDIKGSRLAILLLFGSYLALIFGPNRRAGTAQ